MFDPETQTFLESGCALIVGTVGSDGAPHAGRGWGLEILDGDPEPRFRLLLDVEDERTLEHLSDGGAIAVTATSVLTLRSIQLKGRASDPEATTPDDHRRARRYIDQFFADAHMVDQTPWNRFEAFLPAGYVACTVEVHERFDQTPGPGAGARIEATP
jgi:hypothetical protein